VSIYFKKENNANNDASNAMQPNDGGVQPNEVVVQRLTEGISCSR